LDLGFWIGVSVDPQCIPQSKIRNPKSKMAEKRITPKKTNGPSGAGGAAGARGPMDVDLLEQLVRLMAANDLNTVDLRDGDRRVVLKRGQPLAAGFAGGLVPYAAPPPPSAAAGAPSGAAALSPAAQPAAPAAGGDEAGLVSIKSEMVGTFYSKPSPDAKPFVAVGSDVDEETVVCVIEAMKHFNPVKADVRGTIAKVLVSDGQTVDVGKPLFLVRPA
jgi:acetyl-CoA carboxylase biotin carboxyl carrier protein